MTYGWSLVLKGGMLLVVWISVIVVRAFAMQITNVPFNDWTSAQHFVVASLCVIAFVATVCSGIFFYSITGYFEQLQNQKLLQRFPGIYRVKARHAASIVLLAPNATVLAGDYGWQAESVQSDELIYLHGLNEDWYVVWYAGFVPSELELVGAKPENQYNRRDWQKSICKCPFVVQSKIPVIASLGLPRTMIGRWVQGVLIPKKGKGVSEGLNFGQ